MRDTLWILGLLLIVGVIIASGCGPIVAQPTESPTAYRSRLHACVNDSHRGSCVRADRGSINPHAFHWGRVLHGLEDWDEDEL